MIDIKGNVLFDRNGEPLEIGDEVRMVGAGPKAVIIHSAHPSASKAVMVAYPNGTLSGWYARDLVFVGIRDDGVYEGDHWI